MQRLWPLVLLLCSGCVQVIQRMDDEDVHRLRQRIHHNLGPQFGVEIVDDLFVVASDTDEEQTARALRILREYHAALNRTYFERAPNRPVRVYLFSNKEAYSGYINEQYTDPPRTPFGFYMPNERKIVINIATGTGTLAHELVHPLMEADFPRAPSWFNEGFASLFEESKYGTAGRIEGLVNWRVHTLQRALRRHAPPTLRSTATLDRDDFYDEGSGLNYAVARFLCLYLQEQEVLVEYYKLFRDNYREDRSGLIQLEWVLQKPLSEIERDFRKWALDLREE